MFVFYYGDFIPIYNQKHFILCCLIFMYMDIVYLLVLKDKSYLILSYFVMFTEEDPVVIMPLWVR